MPMQSVGELYRGMSLRDEMERRKREAMARQRDLGYQAQTPGYSRYATGAINDLAPSPLEAMALSQIPGLSDAAGLASDARRMYDNPAERTWGNMGLAAAGALPFVPSGLAEPVVKAVKRMAPGDARMATAQRNASLPVADGGLGLPADNTAMQRAEAMGYTKQAYHGTGADISQPNKTVWGSETPSLANEYAFARGGMGGNPSVYPLSVNKGRTFDANVLPKTATIDKFLTAAVNDAKASGKDVDMKEISRLRERIKKGAALEESGPHYGRQDFWFETRPTFGVDGSNALSELFQRLGIDSIGLDELGNKTIGILEPSNVRSQFAAFDPMRRHESDMLGRADPRLLAAIGIGGLGAAAAAPSLYDAWLGQEQQ